MKTAVESLGPTRVRLTVEVPFDELQPSVDEAYKKIARQVRIQGFRPGKVPPPVIDRRVGRAAVLEEAVNDALPQFYGRAIEENSVAIVGRPDLEVTEFTDGGQLAFTAEVDVRPDIELPAFDAMPVTVDPAVVTDDEVDEQLTGLRERFATLSAAGRPAERGDYVTIDLKAVVDGEEVPGGSATGLSYEVGGDDLMPGLDDALVGMADGDTKTFQTDLTQGEYAGKQADVTVTARSVRVKQVPDLDDDFAQTASEFDTIAELRDDIRTRLERIRRLEQGVQARDRVLDALLERVEVPLPETIVSSEIEWRQHSLAHQLEQAGLSKASYVEIEGKSEADFDADFEKNAREAVKAQFVLDAIADKEEMQVAEEELADQLVRRATRAAMAPDDYARQLVESGGVGTLVAEVRRGKALALVLDAAQITDSNGQPVDLSALNETSTGESADTESADTDATDNEAADDAPAPTANT
jgi:trigger factor